MGYAYEEQMDASNYHLFSQISNLFRKGKNSC